VPRVAYVHAGGVGVGFGSKHVPPSRFPPGGDGTIREVLFDIVRRNVWPAPYTGRVLRNEFSERWYGRKAELLQHQDEEAARYDEARAVDDFSITAVVAGEAVDLITAIPPTAKIVERMATQAE
jgi:nitronate monooxygenase